MPLNMPFVRGVQRAFSRLLGLIVARLTRIYYARYESFGRRASRLPPAAASFCKPSRIASCLGCFYNVVGVHVDDEAMRFKIEDMQRRS